MDRLIDWLPWLAVAVIPGFLNIIVAYVELDEKCKELPFFEPYKIPGVWMWAVIQFFLPAGLFWGVFQLSARPPIDQALLLKAILSGVGAITLLNAEVKIGSERFNFKSRLYDPLIRIAYSLIENNQKRKAAEFWTDIRTELNETPGLGAGLVYLEEYFTIEVEPRPSNSYVQRLHAIATISDKAEQVRAITSLLKEVNRQDLIYVLQRFQCRLDILTRYFPRKMSRIGSLRNVRKL